MSDQCATCGAADVILFTCGYCGREFCADHDLPHHSCEGFAHPGEGVDEVAFEWETGGRTDPDDAFTESGFRPATGATGAAARRPAPRSLPESAERAVTPAPRPTADGAAPAVERRPRTVTRDTTPAVRPAPRAPLETAERAVTPAPEPAPEPTTTAGIGVGPATATAAPTGESSAASHESSATSHIRTMDAKRSPGTVERQEPRTLTEWLHQQTYVSLSVKTAALATVINGALYLGMVVTLYGLLPV